MTQQYPTQPSLPEWEPESDLMKIKPPSKLVPLGIAGAIMTVAALMGLWTAAGDASHYNGGVYITYPVASIMMSLPLAIPTIMAGVNQVIMLALSMAVIAGMVGADGLGQEVVSALAKINIAKGTEAGLSIVFLAIFLDRVTSALGAPREKGSLPSLIDEIRRRYRKWRHSRALLKKKRALLKKGGARPAHGNQ